MSKNTVQIPIISLTAQAAREDILQGTNAGFAAYLTKLVRPAKFVTIIRNVLDSES